MTKPFFFLFLLFFSISSYAQWERYGGVYAAYPAPDNIVATPAPKGYHPFYISMFARHGSRWLPDERRYDAIDSVFADTSNLTALGKDVRQRLLRIHDDARGRAGELTAVGERQHRGLAERMVGQWGEVFAGGGVVEARSSTVNRCAMSMTAFLVRLAQLRPALDISAATGKRYMRYIAYVSPEEQALEDSVRDECTMNPRRLMRSLFRNPDRVAHWNDIAQELHTIASDTQDTGTGISLYDIFTEDEMRQIYDMNNRRMQLCNGINPLNNGTPQRCAASLWRDIVDKADRAIAEYRHRVASEPSSDCSSESPSACPSAPSSVCPRHVADLRFGHDTSLYRLLSLLGLFASDRCMDVIIPMAANLQLVFFTNAGNDVIVKLMHNEREIALPQLEKSRGKEYSLPWPYYRWSDVKAINL